MDFKEAPLFVIFWACCVSLPACAQTVELSTSQYYPGESLGEGINDIIQDSRGFIWVATCSGLKKFDGHDFTSYNHSAAFSKGTSSNSMTSLWEDGAGRLWVGHGEGLDVFDPVTHKFCYPLPDIQVKESWSGVKVTRLRGRHDGNLFICTTAGVFLANPNTLLITRLDLPPFFYFDVAETGGIVWAASREGLVRFDTQSGQTECFVSDTENSGSLSHNLVLTLYADSRERLWVGTAAGLDLLNSDGKSFTRFMPDVKPLDIEENRDAKLWIASEDGFYEFSPETRTYTRIKNDYANSVTEDNQGSVWLGCLDVLQKLSFKSSKFRIYNRFKNIGPIAEDGRHRVWMAAATHVDPNKQQLFTFDPSLTDFIPVQHDPADPNSFSGDFLSSIFTDQRGYLWLASGNGTLEAFGPDKQRYSHMPFNTFGVTAFHIDSKKQFWFGHWNWVGQWGRDTMQAAKSYPSGTVYTFLEDFDNNLWIGTSAGLIRHNLKTGAHDIFQNDPANPRSLSSNTVFDLVMDRRGTIWIGTGKGINQIVKGTENGTPEFAHWTNEASRSSNNQVYCIVDGRDGTLWMTWGNMISHFFVDEGVFQNYDHSDGLSGRNFRGSPFFPGKGIRSRDGYILFGSSDGLVIFHPDSIHDNPFVPSVVLTNFSVRGRSIPVKDTPADTAEWIVPLRQSITDTDKLSLPYDQNDFTIEFAALSFINQERNQYKFKLEPYEKDWVVTNAGSRVARYTNLSPGEYTFTVIGSNNDGIWSDKGASLVITIMPPWWRSWWAYSAYALVATALVVSWRMRIAQRVAMQDVKSRFLANISHEFRTSISLILGPLKDLIGKSNNDDQKRVLGVMLKNGQRLSSLANQLMELNKMDAGQMTMTIDRIDLVQFTRELGSSYESLAADSKIRYRFWPEIEWLTIPIDSEKIEKVIHNLLSNAFKFTPPGGEVTLSVKAEGKWAIISVRDTGIGIPADQLDKIFNRYFQVERSQTRPYGGTGLGMSIAKELVELHHGRITVESRERQGTTFMVYLPLRNEHHPPGIAGPGLHRLENPVPALPGHGLAIASRTYEVSTSADHQPILLIVEDNQDMRQYIRSTLSDTYQIVEAENGREGVSKSAAVVPDLIISDIMMPELDGYELCEQVRSNKTTRHIPIILLTARTDRQSRMAGLELGVEDYLCKPFDGDELKLIVRNRVREKRRVNEQPGGPLQEHKTNRDNSLEGKFLRKVTTIIENRMGDENFAVKELADEAGYSSMQLYRKIKALSGQTPSVFLRTLRLNHAAQMLSDRSDTVSQIAFSVGFNNLSYFNKCFKEQFGVTPGQYAKGQLSPK